MANTDDLTRIENKFKLSLLQTEKRLVNLEVAIAELEEKLKKVDLEGIQNLKQKVEDLEELKTSKKDLVAINVRIGSLEESIKNFEGLEKAPVLNKEIEDKMNKIREFERSITENTPGISNMETNELISRIIALEARIGALERITQNKTKDQPVVLE